MTTTVIVWLDHESTNVVRRQICSCASSTHSRLSRSVFHHKGGTSMANASLVITWGNSIPGRENQSVELFMGIVQKYTGLQAEGKIAGHSAHMATSGNTNNFASA